VVLYLSGLPTRSRSAEDQALVSRTRAAARAVRDQFIESGVVEPVLYDPEMPLFVRAMREADVKPADPAAPAEEDRVAIAKAVGALYSVEVTTYDPPAEKGLSAIDLEMRATSVETRKAWDERTLATAGGGFSPVRSGGGDGPDLAGPGTPATATTPAGNAVISAANTLVLRFLAGPMRDYFKDAVPPSLLPPRAAVPVVPDSGPAPAGAAMTPAPSAAPPSAPTPATTEPKPAPAPAAPPVVVGPVPQQDPTPNPPAPVPAPAVKPAPPFTTPAPVTPAPAAPAATVTDSSQGATDAQAEALRQQGEQQVAAGETDAAVLSLRRAVNLAPTNTRMRLSLVRAYAAAKRYPDAIAEGRRALTVAHPEDGGRPAPAGRHQGRPRAIRGYHRGPAGDL
jgi:hypothetical protein